MYGRKVPNQWIFFGTLAGIWFRNLDFLVPAGIVIIATFFLFRLRVLGAGDGKLMALVAGYLGIPRGVYAIGAGFVVGAIWSLCLLWHKRDIVVRLNNLSAYIWQIFLTKTITAYGTLSKREESETVPLAACLALGTWLYLLTSWIANTGKGFL